MASESSPPWVTRQDEAAMAGSPISQEPADRRDYAKQSAVTYLANAEAIAEVCMSGLAHRLIRRHFVLFLVNPVPR